METIRILVVDDEPGMREGVKRALRDWQLDVPELDESAGVEVSMAASGREALDRVAKGATDILLLDHKLPELSGLEVLKELRERTDMLKIMITAYASLETAIAATKLGAFDFLAKPFTPAELRAAIQKATRHLLLQRQALKLAQERKQVRFQFLSVLAHELKAPLSAIEGYLHIIKSRSAGQDMAVYDHMVERSIFRAEGMRKMIMDLLDLTRIESGLKKRELVDLDFVDVARTAMETIAPDAAARQIKVEMHSPPTLPLRADRGELEILLNNLLTNAVKYNRPGGSVDLTIAAEGQALTVTVSDTGIGMSPQEAAKLFQDFSRIRNEKTRDIVGSGLGLALVKKLARLYDGDVSVQSTPDVGSTFKVTLRPASQAAEHEVVGN